MGKIHVVPALLVGLVVILAALLALILWRLNCCCHKRKPTRSVTIRSSQSLQAGIAKLHNNNNHRFDHSSKLFSWSDHPSSVTDAVENGWSRFAFTSAYTSSPSTPSKRLLGLFAIGEQSGVRETEPEMTWEVCEGSADAMQKIRLNCGLKMALNSGNNASATASVMRTALPLPGPPLAFPE